MKTRALRPRRYPPDLYDGLDPTSAASVLAFTPIHAPTPLHALILPRPSDKNHIYSPIWCNVVKTVKGTGKMVQKREAKAKKKAPSTEAVRASISFPPDMHGTLEQIAKDKKVSLAWVVREAIDTYLGEKWPLFKQGGPQRR